MKTYLGDSVYVEEEEGTDTLILTTENGKEGDPSNTIYLNSEVIMHLFIFVEGLK